MNKSYVEVRRRSPRFQLIRREIESLASDGVYHFVANCEGVPIEYRATRAQLEFTFAQAMRTPSYLEGGRYHNAFWPMAEQFRVRS